MIVWVWEEVGVLAHARNDELDHSMSLCAKPLRGRPLMRPPFPAMRCQACDEAKGAETQVFPNPYAKNLA